MVVKAFLNRIRSAGNMTLFANNYHSATIYLGWDKMTVGWREAEDWSFAAAYLVNSGEADCRPFLGNSPGFVLYMKGNENGQ